MTPAEVTASALSFDAVLLGTLVMLLMQIVKGFAPNLSGRDAEIGVVLVSAVVVLLVLWGMDVNWYDDKTYLVFIIELLKTTYVARATYKLLFAVSVTGSPPSSEATVQPEDVHDPQATDPYDALPDDQKPIAAAVMKRSRGTRRTAIDTSE